jgi:GNAT superfamily N-acetyltransferase
MAVRVYEYVPEERDELLSFRNAIFGHVSHDQWEAMNCTGVVARERERLVGFIPLQYRQQCLNAQVAIPVVYENAVGVAEGLRGRGIGTEMINKAASFMSDRVDALMVIRGGERSDGYRFYRKTGHGDLMYAHWYRLPAHVSWSQEDVAGISVLNREQWIALEPQLLDLYHREYGLFGGGQRRAPGYWNMILDGHVYRGHKWWLVCLTSEGDDARPMGSLTGYLVAAQGIWSSTSDVYIYEVVSKDQAALETLIRYAHRFALDDGTGVSGGFGVALVSAANPIRTLLRRMGFVEAESGPHVMARILRPDRIFGQLAAGSDLLDTLSLTVVTPHRTMVVNDPPSAKYAVQFATKESILSRLFCCRLDLSAALDMELVRWSGDDPGLKRELSYVFRYAEWVQWFTDYV